MGCLGVLDDDEILNDESSNIFASGANQNAGNSLTNRSSTHLSQAPGGNSTICLGCDDSEDPKEDWKEPRPSPGGPTSISLTYDETPSKCAPLEEFCEPEPAGLFLGPPDGQDTICFGASDRMPLSDVLGIPPGGKSSICLGMANLDDCTLDDSETSVDNRSPKPVGGASTLCLGTAELSPQEQSNRQAPGGNTTICLGEDFGDENTNTSNTIVRTDLCTKKILGESDQIVGCSVISDRLAGDPAANCDALE